MTAKIPYSIPVLALCPKGLSVAQLILIMLGCAPELRSFGGTI